MTKRRKGGKAESKHFCGVSRVRSSPEVAKRVVVTVVYQSTTLLLLLSIMSAGDLSYLAHCVEIDGADRGSWCSPASAWVLDLSIIRGETCISRMLGLVVNHTICELYHIISFTIGRAS